MHRLSIAALGVLAAGCIEPTARAPEPVSLHVSDAPRDVVQRAAVALTSAGFRVAQTDEVGNDISASRRSSANGNEPFVTCNNVPRDSGAAANRETTIMIDFSAKPTGGGSDVTIRSNVRTAYPGFDGTPMQMATSDSDCVSTGLMERRLADSIR